MVGGVTLIYLCSQLQKILMISIWCLLWHGYNTCTKCLSEVFRIARCCTNFLKIFLGEDPQTPPPSPGYFQGYVLINSCTVKNTPMVNLLVSFFLQNYPPPLLCWKLKKSAPPPFSEMLDPPLMNELLQNTALMSRILQITIKLYFNPATASAIGYEKRLLILGELYRLHFRIFFYNQDLDCKPELISQNKFLSCYSIYFIRAQKIIPPIIQLPAEDAMRKMSSIEHVRLYDRYLSSLQIMCQQNIRVGNIKAGGLNLCQDLKYRPKYPCLAYSFGINTDWTFDEELTQTYGCDVFSCDPSIGRIDYRHSAKVWFHNLGINNKNIDQNWKLRNIDTIMRMLNHTNRKLDILKVDAERAEWPSLLQMFESGTLQKVGQLYLEFHRKADYKKLVTMKRLYDLGFRIFWTHKNLVCSLPLGGGFSTSCFEVYFLNTRFYKWCKLNIIIDDELK